MSVFKTIGAKLKRVVSLNNLTRAVSGNFSAIGADVIRVATTKSPAEMKKGASSTEQVYNVAPLASIVNDTLDSQGKKVSDSVVTKVADNPFFAKVTDIFTKAAVKSQWEKYRNWIIGFVVAGGLFLVGWKVLKKGKNSSGRARRPR